MHRLRRLRRTTLTLISCIGLTMLQGCEPDSSGPSDGAPLITDSTDVVSVTLVGAGNIARCATADDDATADLLDAIPGTVVALGDNALPNGRLIDYQNCYGSSWGRHLARTRAVAGNHEYDTSDEAAGAFDYFGDRLGPRPLGYYSFELGEWHVIVLNDHGPTARYGLGSAQDQWLATDLAANAKPCVLAMWHTPRFHSSNVEGWTGTSSRQSFWDRLFAAGADVVLNGQHHIYERMAPMRPDGTRDDVNGIHQFNVGTGGDALGNLPTVAVHPNSEVRAAVFGVLKLTLRPGAYAWEFVPVAGETFADSGSGFCDPESRTNTPPVADAGGPYRSEAVAFDGTASSDANGDTLTYAWDFGDPGAAATPSHAYAADGPYTVSLTVSDAHGAASAPATVTATIANLPHNRVRVLQ